MDPEVAVRPVRKGGKVTKVPREKKVKGFPRLKARDLSCKLQEWIARHLTMSSTAAL